MKKLNARINFSLSPNQRMIHTNQITAAQEITDAYRDGENYVVMRAQMQSGKTGAFMIVGAELIRSGHIERFVVISANNDADLKAQLKNPDDFWTKDYIRYLLDIHGIDVYDALDLSGQIKSKFSCYCGSDLKKIHTVTEKTLFIWDESHHGQSKGQSMDKFFKTLGLQPDGSRASNEHLMLSVSATPFSEIIDNDRMEQEKCVVTFLPGEGYFGVKQMMEHECLQEFHERMIPSLIYGLKHDPNHCAGFIRSRSIKNANIEESVKRECQQHGVHFILYDQNCTETTIEEIMSTTTPTCIFVKSRLGMGKCLPGKEKIQWIVETNDSKLDTALQGLLGRVCGYESSGSGAHIKVYLPSSVLRKIRDSGYIQVMYGTWQYGKFAPAMNTKRKKEYKILYDAIAEKCIIPLNPQSWDLNRSDLISLVRDFITSSEFDSCSKNRVNYPKAFDSLKQNARDESNLYLSCLNNASYQGHKEKLLKSYHKEDLLEKVGHGCGFQNNSNDHTIRVWYTNLPTQTDTSWTVYVQSREKTPPPPGKFMYNTANTTGKEIFRHRNEDGTEAEINGVSQMALTPETATDPTRMLQSIQEAIQFSQQADHLQIPNKISAIHSSNTGINGILVNQQVYDGLKRGGIIYNTILQENQKTLKITKYRGRAPANLPEWCVARIVSIEWL